MPKPVLEDPEAGIVPVQGDQRFRLVTIKTWARFRVVRWNEDEPRTVVCHERDLGNSNPRNIVEAPDVGAGSETSDADH